MSSRKVIPIYKSVTTLLYIENQTQYGFLNEAMATPLLHLILTMILSKNKGDSAKHHHPYFRN
jgi:hypothetical protein